jgi:hypothetical protein
MKNRRIYGTTEDTEKLSVSSKKQIISIDIGSWENRLVGK